MDYKAEYERLLEIEKFHREENGRLRVRVQDLERQIDDLKETFTS